MPSSLQTCSSVICNKLQLQLQLYTIHGVTVMITLQSVVVKLLVVAATHHLYLVCCCCCYCYCCCCCCCCRRLWQCLVCRFGEFSFPLIKYKVEKFQIQVKQSVVYRKYRHSHTYVHLAVSYVAMLCRYCNIEICLLQEIQIKQPMLVFYSASFSTFPIAFYAHLVSFNNIIDQYSLIEHTPRNSLYSRFNIIRQHCVGDEKPLFN